jgi:hypothetical protein
MRNTGVPRFEKNDGRFEKNDARFWKKQPRFEKKAALPTTAPAKGAKEIGGIDSEKSIFMG